MRRILTALALALLTLTGATSAAASPPAPAESGAANATGWYLALGDSLAAGYLAGQGDHPQGGYVGGVLDDVRADEGRTKLENLACSGETTSSMIVGGRCAYDAGSQLDAAVEFLHAHGRFTRLVTIDIGGNDIATCGFQGLPPACTSAGLATLRANLPTILQRLRAAAGPDVPIVVLNYYDPFLAFWLLDTPGSSTDDVYGDLATGSLALLGTVNGIIGDAAAGADAQVADVATAFSTEAFTPTVPLPGYGEVPLNVARICQWTTMCTQQDFHATPAGYAVMAEAVVAVID